MRKKEIAQRIHQEAGISEEEASTLLEGILELLKTTLQKGESITIPGFGKFTVRKKLPRKAWNFKTGEALMIPPRRVVTFRPRALFKAEVNAVRNEKQEAVM